MNQPDHNPWTPEVEAAALAHCMAFEGTRHMARRNRPGHGVDCLRFVIGTLQAAGMLPEFDYPQYGQTLGLGAATNHMAAILLAHTRSHSITPPWEPRTGDVGIFKVGRVSNHVGVVVAGRFWHVTINRACHHCAIATVTGQLQEVIRLDAPGLTRQPDTTQIT